MLPPAKEGSVSTPALSEERLAGLHLSVGGHERPSEGHCLLEVVSMFAGEEFSDHPACVDPVLAAFGRRWNDALTDQAERDHLKRYIPMLVGTRGSVELSRLRAWMAVDWSIRVHAPIWLDLTDALKPHAEKLRALAPITDRASADAALPVIRAARADADADAYAYAAYAAYAAAYAYDADAAAYADAAASSASSASSAYAADADAAASSASSAAHLKTARCTAQSSMHDLYERMIKASCPAPSPERAGQEGAAS
ncbi:hypothetical protein [Piscinibacter sp.]|uniref:hypothetical protein n=1 Tax=Piscinibacter sp. TaxID=1903157 RepID=UPI0039E287E9